MKKKIRLDALDIIVLLLAVVIILGTLLPMLNVFSLSLSNPKYIVGGEVSFYPKGFTLNAYKEMLSSSRIPRAYANSILYTGVGVLFNLFFTVITAYPLARKELVGRKWIIIFITITMFFNAGMIPKYLLVSELGMMDSMWGLIIPTVIWTFYLTVMRNFFEGIPNELYEASVIDGASEFQILARVYFPLAKPAVASIALYYIMGHWNSFFIPSIYITSAEKYPLQVVLRDLLNTAVSSNFNMAETIATPPVALKNAVIFISIVPMLIAYPFLQKYFTKGMMVGAVKG
ncbi:carbohydrate ABC transporter permease [Ruminococcaceae bacterium OttesenSCG-928-D13]|nr:carbohydrate ABC transporter permease [Ruminococcaceae bacterium OttesenSCG-928-D13]